MRVLVIDPGLSGAVVLLSPDGLQIRRDFKSSEDIACAIVELAPSATEAVIELVGARPGQGTTSMFNFGHATGVALGALNACNFSIFDKSKKLLIESHPRVWQEYVREVALVSAGDPFNSLEIARKFFPHAGGWLLRMKDHNTADALLMGLWYIAVRPARGSMRKRDKKRWRAIDNA